MMILPALPDGRGSSIETTRNDMSSWFRLVAIISRPARRDVRRIEDRRGTHREVIAGVHLHVADLVGQRCVGEGPVAVQGMLVVAVASGHVILDVGCGES